MGTHLGERLPELLVCVTRCAVADRRLYLRAVELREAAVDGVRDELLLLRHQRLEVRGVRPQALGA